MKRLIIFIACFGFYLSTKAQADAPLNLSLEQAIDLGSKYNASLKNSAIDVKLAEQRVREILSSGFPQVNASGSLNDYILSPVTLVPAQFFNPNASPNDFAEVHFVPKYNVGAGVSASQLIFNGSYIVGVQASREYAAFIKVQLEKTKFDVERDITKAYLTVLSTQETESILEESKKRIDKQLNDLSEIYKQGLIEKLDVDRVKLLQSQLAQQQDQIKTAVSVLKSLLNLQMGYDVTKPVNLTSTLEDLNRKFGADLYASTSFDANKKFEMQILNKGLELQALNIRANKMGYYPSLVAIGSYQISGQNNTFEFPKYYKTAIVGLQLSIPIFDGFAKDSRITQAKLSLLQMQNTKASVQNALTMAYINANTNVSNAKKQLELNKLTLSLAETVYNTTATKYKEGVGSSFELTTADSDLKNARIQNVVAQYNLISAIFDLKIALGN
jgi:outer membrane protein